MTCKLDLPEHQQGANHSLQVFIKQVVLFFPLHFVFCICFYLLHNLYLQMSPSEHPLHGTPSLYGLLRKLPLQKKNKSFYETGCLIYF